jgi:hypothetical protein
MKLDACRKEGFTRGSTRMEGTAMTTLSDQDRPTLQMDVWLPLRLYGASLAAVLLFTTCLVIADVQAHTTAETAVLLVVAFVEVAAGGYLLLKPWWVKAQI